MNKFKKNLKNIWLHRLEILVLLSLIFQFNFPHYAFAFEEKKDEKSIILPNFVISSEKSDKENRVSIPTLIRKEEKVLRTYHIPITAYSSTVDQCYGDPCITANGFNVCKHNQEDVIAANFLPFGTKVRIPELFGDKIFTVQDRMNSRYYYRADIWMKTRQAAIKFGIAYTTIEVLE